MTMASLTLSIKYRTLKDISEYKFEQLDNYDFMEGLYNFIELAIRNH